MKKILHLTIFLALVAAISGGALAFANNLTAPIIAENALAAEKENLKLMFPDAADSDFQQIDVKGNSKTIEKIFTVAGTKTIFKLQVTGYKDGTSFMVAFDESGTITHYVVISNGDTQGIGSKVADDSFADSLIGKKGNEKLDTISGATISSTPVVDGINEAAQYFADNMK